MSRLTGWMSLLLPFGGTSLLGGQELNEASFERVRDQILPNAGEEGWRAIPWRSTLGAGVAEAQRHDKPILLWVMNGHPLGCT